MQKLSRKAELKHPSIKYIASKSCMDSHPVLNKRLGWLVEQYKIFKDGHGKWAPTCFGYTWLQNQVKNQTTYNTAKLKCHGYGEYDRGSDMETFASICVLLPRVA